MRFDDRLLTVLNQPAGDRHDAAVRWRQLVDLVARAGPNSASPVVARRWKSIRSDAAKVEESLRAAAARAVAALPLPLGLARMLRRRPAVGFGSGARRGQPRAGAMAGLLASADDETRRFAETLHPELAGRRPVDG